MKIDMLGLTVRDLVDGYQDDDEGGVRGYGGRLDIRPPYQREFIYKGSQRAAVITTIQGGFPLNVMYWAVRDDGGFEVIDGQQRTISIAQYVKSDFAVNGLYFHNLTLEERDEILDYKLMIYRCTGTHRDKLDWFRTVNIAGEKLYDQELRNAALSGSWVSDAKRYFSRTGCVAAGLASDYMTGSPIRQDYLETVIKWISDAEAPEGIEDYMARHQHDANALPLWEYFREVIDWVETTFNKKRKKIMRGVDWGILYNAYKDEDLDPSKIEQQTRELILDDDVENKKGIYPYILTGEEKHLNIRAFKPGMRQQKYEEQAGKCAKCEQPFELSEMEADHITPWSQGGKTIPENCQMLCRPCNRKKGKK
ncbi:MAG: HNH endonuclease [Chloroflexi bacterium]|nr:HNH endonuclease [Chloroflexota bacterium]MCY4246905.1 HNH endonuclease [Chloroflexota bacterium]